MPCMKKPLNWKKLDFYKRFDFERENPKEQNLPEPQAHGNFLWWTFYFLSKEWISELCFHCLTCKVLFCCFPADNSLGRISWATVVDIRDVLPLLSRLLQKQKKWHWQWCSSRSVRSFLWCGDTTSKKAEGGKVLILKGWPAAGALFTTTKFNFLAF